MRFLSETPRSKRNDGTPSPPFQPQSVAGSDSRSAGGDVRVPRNEGCSAPYCGRSSPIKFERQLSKRLNRSQRANKRERLGLQTFLRTIRINFAWIVLVTEP